PAVYQIAQLLPRTRAQGFGIVALEPASLCADFKFRSDAARCCGAHRGKAAGIGCEIEHAISQRNGIAFGDEKCADTFLNGFRNAAMAGGADRQPRGHGLKHGIWHSFLVAVRAQFTGVEEKMSPSFERPKIRLREKTGEANPVCDPEFGRES